MNWKFVDSNFQDSESKTDFQMDEVGNVIQRLGGVNPKACQNCKREFGGNVIEDEVKQRIKFYKCNSCDFKSSIPDETLTHVITNKDHELEIETESRIVGYKNTLSGLLPMITYKENDVIIFCSECNALD